MTNELLLISTAFNKPSLIRHQIRLLKKFLLDPHAFVVVDNSIFMQCIRDEIAGICKEEETTYFSAPEFEFFENGSRSHGSCLNWSYDNIVVPSDKRYFGFIDHDVFPIKANSIIKRMNGSGMMGIIRKDVRSERWYLGASFCLYDRSVIGQDIKLDFMPGEGLDTGGGNYQALYSKVDASSLPRMLCVEKNMRDQPIREAAWDACLLLGPEEDGLTWMHAMNSSEYLGEDRGRVRKEILVERYLRSL